LKVLQKQCRTFEDATPPAASQQLQATIYITKQYTG
jgi:hypothetical protein